MKNKSFLRPMRGIVALPYGLVSFKTLSVGYNELSHLEET